MGSLFRVAHQEVRPDGCEGNWVFAGSPLGSREHQEGDLIRAERLNRRNARRQPVDHKVEPLEGLLADGAVMAE